jgi:hypothetical protein
MRYDKPIGGSIASRNADIDPDGQRFIALMPATETKVSKEAKQVTFPLNFFDELRRRVPVGK